MAFASDDLFATANRMVGHLPGAVLLPGVRAINDDTLALLAAGFFRGEKSAPAIPYARLET